MNCTEQFKVSIILPFHNVEKYVQKCLDSIVNQTLKEIEIICINDCTSDRSFDIVKEYAARDSRFVLIEHETNQGQGIARNNGIAIARGEYIGFVDPDDWIEPTMFQTMYEAIKNHDADMVEAPYFINYEQASVVKRGKLCIKNPTDKTYNYLKLNKNYPFSAPLAVWSKLTKTDLIRRHNILFSDGTKAEDHIFTIKCRILADKIYFCKQIFYHYLIRNNSASSYDIIPFGKAVQRIKLLEEVKEFLIRNGCYEIMSDAFWEYAIKTVSEYIRSLSKDHQDSFENHVLQFIPEKYHSYYISRKSSHYTNFGEKLFSVKNLNLHQGRFKVLTIFGIKIPLKKRIRGQR